MSTQQDIEERALALPARARQLVVQDHAGFTAAAEFLGGVKTLRAQIGETFDPLIAAAFQSHKVAVAAKKKIEAPVAEAEVIVKGMMGRYHQEQERLRREAEEAARRERERLAAVEAERLRLAREAEERALQAALEAERQGKAEEAARIIETAPVAAPQPVPEVKVVAAPPPPRAAGISVGERWEFEVTDAALVPREYCTIDETKIRGVVRTLKGATRIPGVRVFAVPQVGARTGRA